VNSLGVNKPDNAACTRCTWNCQHGLPTAFTRIEHAFVATACQIS